MLQLLSEGYRVVTTGRNLAKLQAVYSTADPNLGFVEVDLETATGPADCIAKAMAILPRLDVLVNNAGGGYIGQQIEKAAPELFDSCFALNVRSPFFLIQAAIPHLVAASISTADANAASDAPSSSSASTPGSGAVVINLSSVAAQRPFSGMGPYCMSKAAVDMLTQVRVQVRSVNDVVSCRCRGLVVVPPPPHDHRSLAAHASPGSLSATIRCHCDHHRRHHLQIAAIELAPRNVRVCGVAPGTVSTEFHNSAGSY